MAIAYYFSHAVPLTKLEKTVNAELQQTAAKMVATRSWEADKCSEVDTFGAESPLTAEEQNRYLELVMDFYAVQIAPESVKKRMTHSELAEMKALEDKVLAREAELRTKLMGEVAEYEKRTTPERIAQMTIASPKLAMAFSRRIFSKEAFSLPTLQDIAQSIQSLSTEGVQKGMAGVLYVAQFASNYLLLRLPYSHTDITKWLAYCRDMVNLQMPPLSPGIKEKAAQNLCSVSAAIGGVYQRHSPSQAVSRMAEDRREQQLPWQSGLAVKLLGDYAFADRERAGRLLMAGTIKAALALSPPEPLSQSLYALVEQHHLPVVRQKA